MSEYKLYLGNCLDHLEFMPDNSVDSIVTDPPYGLSFMGKKWDYDVPAVEIWAECLRVLKPGGHLLAFAGTRTQHRMACNIEDAGFEIRDMVTFLYDTNETAKALIESLSPEQIKMLDATFGRDGMLAWTYGSGFPKSMDVSKAVDSYVTTGKSDSLAIKDVNLTRPGEAIIRHQSQNGHRGFVGSGSAGASVKRDEPATEQGGNWRGWGTALKPALEPITVARKPFKGTVAANVLAHGTGAINIDKCRVGSEVVSTHSRGTNGAFPKRPGETTAEESGRKKDQREGLDHSERIGRWPANLIHDGSHEVLALFPANAGAQAPVKGTEDSAASTGNVTGKRARVKGAFHADSGSAARFFKQVEVTDAEWLENLSPALIAGSTLSLSKLADAIAQSDAAISALPEGRQLNVLKAPSTSVTLSESKLIATSVITAIQSIASASLLAQQPERLSLSRSHVSVVAHQTPTGTMTITASLSSSAGCAESITFSITPKSLVAGEKGCEQSSARFMYCAKASKADRGPENNHPTVKPTDLMAYLCRLVTPPGGVVLDPFMGSGSTGKAAIREGFQFVGIEMDPEYLAIAEARIKHEANKNTR